MNREPNRQDYVQAISRAEGRRRNKQIQAEAQAARIALAKIGADDSDQLFVRYCSHPDGHAPKDCPDAHVDARTGWPKCVECGAVLYVGQNQRALYCSATCRSRAWRRLQRAATGR